MKVNMHSKNSDLQGKTESCTIELSFSPLPNILCVCKHAEILADTHSSLTLNFF